jgi:thymidylate synthase (FAD)
MKAEYVDHLGDDLRVVNAARVSFDKESELETVEIVGRLGAHEFLEGVSLQLSDKDAKLIRYLATHGHFTPFTHPQITLRETVPIFVARQRFKHKVGFTENEVSRRYVDDGLEFYMPDEWRKAPEGSVKQGSSREPVTDWLPWYEPSVGYLYGSEVVAHLYEQAQAVYEYILRCGGCPEQARMVLPQSMMTSYYVTGSLAAFARAYKQRSDSHAQLEIQYLADQWDTVIRPLFPVSWGALVDG